MNEWMNLRELREEVGHVMLGGTNLAKGCSNSKSSEEVDEGVVQIGVLREAAAPLQLSQQRRPCAQKHKRHQHAPYCSTLTLHQQHFFFFFFFFFVGCKINEQVMQDSDKNKKREDLYLHILGLKSTSWCIMVSFPSLLWVSFKFNHLWNYIWLLSITYIYH